MKRFGYRHSHKSKTTNYLESEEKNSMDIEQNEDGDNSGRAINENEIKKTYKYVSKNYKRKEKIKELEIIHKIVQLMGVYLKKDEKGKKEYLTKLKDIELGQYSRPGSPAQIINNFLESKYEDKFPTDMMDLKE